MIAYQAIAQTPAQQQQDCVAVFVAKDSTLLHAARALDSTSQGYISRILQQGDITGKLGECLMLQAISPTLAPRTLLIGCDQAQSLTISQYHKILHKLTQALKQTASQSACIHIMDISVLKHDLTWHIQQAIQVIEADYYQFNRFKSNLNNNAAAAANTLKTVVFNVVHPTHLQTAQTAIQQAQAINAGIQLCKDLGNLPGNICTPTYLAHEAQQLAQTYPESLQAEVLDKTTLQQLNMGALLAVAQGSQQPPQLIILRYQGPNTGQTAPIVLVGKGITFDSGGISIKSAAQMDEMKYDMCGGATVFGILKFCAELQLPLSIIGVIAAAENMPDGAAVKPGDIVTSLSGQTIEILNTDAEGRLVLCDALTYCERFNPAVVIDIATLTGACIIALGHHAGAILSNHPPLQEALCAAGEKSHDRIWPLPLWEDYQDALKSPFADMANVGGRPAGTITAACFLSRFTKKFHWAHLDIAGIAWNSNHHKGATGRPVSLLAQYLLSQAATANHQ